MNTSNLRISLIMKSASVGEVELCNVDDQALVANVLSTCIEEIEALVGELESRGVEPDALHLRKLRFLKQVQAKL